MIFFILLLKTLRQKLLSFLVNTEFLLRGFFIFIFFLFFFLEIYTLAPRNIKKIAH